MKQKHTQEKTSLYIVLDYGGELGRFNKLNDARACKRARGEGYQCVIMSRTTTVITLTEEKQVT